MPRSHQAYYRKLSLPQALEEKAGRGVAGGTVANTQVNTANSVN